MNYYEISIKTTSEGADLVADALFSVGAAGVAVEDAADAADIVKNTSNWDYIDENIPLSSGFATVKTTVGEDIYSDFLSALSDALFELKNASEIDLGELSTEVKSLGSSDWKDEWRKHFKPIKTSKITVVPSWIEYHAKEGEKVIYIEPGMAFGTGEHETTRLCLNLMPEVEGKSVLDVGCGSGILGLSAKRLGAKSAHLVDIDAAAVKAAESNAGLNSLEVKISRSDLTEDALKADVVFANITADILIKLSKTIIEHLNPHAKVVLSGIIHQRLDEVKAAYIAAGLNLIGHAADGEWDALLLEY
jgi:ribosomal protein L11 methyltransferase